MGEKTKTYLVDNNPVDVAEQDEQDFLKHNPTAVKAKTFLVGQDTVDVAESDLADFQKHVPDAKPLKIELPVSEQQKKSPVGTGTVLRPTAEGIPMQSAEDLTPAEKVSQLPSVSASPSGEPKGISKKLIPTTYKFPFSTKDPNAFGEVEIDGKRKTVDKITFDKYEVPETKEPEITIPEFENVYQSALEEARQTTPPVISQEEIKRKEKALLAFDEKQTQKTKNYYQQNPINEKEFVLSPLQEEKKKEMRDYGITDRKVESQSQQIRQRGEKTIIAETKNKIITGLAQQKATTKEIAEKNLPDAITKDIIRELSPDQMRLYSVTQEENRLMKKDNPTEEDYKRISELSSERRKYTSQPRFYSPVTLMHNYQITPPTEEETQVLTEEFNTQVAEYSNTDKDLLAKTFEEKYLLQRGLENEYRNIENKYERIAQTGGIAPQTNITLARQRENELSHIRTLLIDSKLQLDAVTEAYLLNENMLDLKEKMSLPKLAGLAFLESIMPENLYKQGVSEGIIPTKDRQKLEAMNKIFTGIKLTEEEEKSFEASVEEGITEGVGGLAGLGLQLMALNYTGNILGVPALIARLKKMGDIGKFSSVLLEPVYEEIKTQSVGLGAGAGAG